VGEVGNVAELVLPGVTWGQRELVLRPSAPALLRVAPLGGAAPEAHAIAAVLSDAVADAGQCGAVVVGAVAAPHPPASRVGPLGR
jgi:hypothetical protein